MSNQDITSEKKYEHPELISIANIEDGNKMKKYAYNQIDGDFATKT